MPNIRARGAIAALGLLALAAAGARHLALSRAEAELSRRGLAWADRDDAWDGARWTGLSRPGLVIEELAVDLIPEPQVALRGVTVDASAMRLDGAARAGAGGDGAQLPVSVEGLTVRWDDRPLLVDLSGTLSPSLDLRGPGAAITRTDAGIQATASLPLDLPHLRGAAEVRVATSDQGLRVEAEIPRLVVEHPILADEPLDPIPAAITATWTEGRLDGALRLGAVTARISGAVGPDPAGLDLRLEAEAVPLASLLDLLGDQVPEAGRAKLVGEVSAVATVKGWPPVWTLRPSASGLGAEGVVPDLSALRHGPFTWAAPSANGPTPRTAGEGVRGWVSLDEAGRMAAAVVSAEDARFWSHDGYDLEGVQVALDALAAGEERPRGGSTLSQQLAKNLFLDGERTVARKARELLYALELDRALGKRRVLELYLNVVELGDGLYGIGPAADAYFLKTPAMLSWREAAFLAAILPSPRTWGQDAWRGGRAPDARIDVVLHNLVDLGTIDAATAAAARRDALRLVPPPTPAR